METSINGKITSIWKLAHDWVVGDIRKAAHVLPNFESFDRDKIQEVFPLYDGGAMIGAAILGMCAIQFISKFSLVKREPDQFEWFVDNYLKKVNDKYIGAEIYQLRNALIKQYALKGVIRAKNNQIIEYCLINGGKHLESSKNGKMLNIINFMQDISKAIDQFFEDVLQKKLPLEVESKLEEHFDKYLIGPIKT